MSQDDFPRKPNGKIDWVRYGRFMVPILSLLVALLGPLAGTSFYLGGRLESPEQKQQRIDNSMAVTREYVRHLMDWHHEHERQVGHTVMEERVKQLTMRVVALEKATSRLEGEP